VVGRDTVFPGADLDVGTSEGPGAAGDTRRAAVSEASRDGGGESAAELQLREV